MYLWLLFSPLVRNNSTSYILMIISYNIYIMKNAIVPIWKKTHVSEKTRGCLSNTQHPWIPSHVDTTVASTYVYQVFHWRAVWFKITNNKINLAILSALNVFIKFYTDLYMIHLLIFTYVGSLKMLYISRYKVPWFLPRSPDNVPCAIPLYFWLRPSGTVR